MAQQNSRRGSSRGSNKKEQQEYDNNNRGALWENTKGKSDQAPDLSGKVTVNGVDYWLAGWYNSDADVERGRPVLSLAFTEIEEEPSGRRK